MMFRASNSPMKAICAILSVPEAICVGGQGFTATRRDCARRRHFALESDAESAGLYAISLGLSYNFADDQTMLKHGLVIYDALYAWCQYCQAEAIIGRRRWNDRTGAEAGQLESSGYRMR